jgi:hypothetical protein
MRNGHKYRAINYRRDYIEQGVDYIVFGKASEKFVNQIT